MAKFIRNQPGSGHRFEAVPNAQGCYEMADPLKGGVKHKKENCVLVKRQSEIIALLKEEYSLRMTGPINKRPVLIAPQNIRIEGAPVD